MTGLHVRPGIHDPGSWYVLDGTDWVDGPFATRAEAEWRIKSIRDDRTYRGVRR